MTAKKIKKIDAHMSVCMNMSTRVYMCVLPWVLRILYSIYMKFSHKTTGKGAIVSGNTCTCMYDNMCQNKNLTFWIFITFKINHQKGSIKLLRLAHLGRFRNLFGLNYNQIYFWTKCINALISHPFIIGGLHVLVNLYILYKKFEIKSLHLIGSDCKVIIGISVVMSSSIN